MFLNLSGPAGRIEALLARPDGPARFAAFVCHPHPLFGGTMHNHATVHLARALASRGGLAVRFQFRGVGRSEGKHDKGVGEVEDALAVARALDERSGGLPLWAAGFSFGAHVALHAAGRQRELSRALVIGMAVRSFDHGFVRKLPIPVGIVQGANDVFGSPGEVNKTVEGSLGPRHMWVVAGASHLLTENLPGLDAAVTRAVDWLLGAA